MLRERLAMVRERMRDAGMDSLVLGPGADYRYLAGYGGHVSERLTALVVFQDGGEIIFVPRLEAPGAEGSGFPLTVWTEEQQPLDLIASALREHDARTIGVGDHLWSRFLLGLQERLPAARWCTASTVIAPVRCIKNSQEIALLRKAGAKADAVWQQVTELPLEGMTERALCDEISTLLVAQGLDGVGFVNVGAGPNGASPHHDSGARTLQRGDMVVIDYGGPLDGYHSDITRTLCIGEAGEEERRIYEIVREAQEIGVQAVRPNVTAGEVDRRTRAHIDAAGLGDWFIHRTGHGLGLELHEPPYIIAESSELLQEGMVFSIEPGVYIPGRFGVRIEDIVVVTPGGCERLNNAPRELAVIQ